jgi:hypothetical protein
MVKSFRRKSKEPPREGKAGKTMMRFLMLGLLALLVGCGPGIREMGAPSAMKGKVTLKSQPFGDVSLYIQPLGEGHPTTVQVAPDGSFDCELVPGKYVYSVGKASSKTSDQALAKVDPKFLETSMERTLVVVAGQDVSVSLD